MKRAFALVVAVENYCSASGLARLDHTVDRAYEFVGWLLNARRVQPHDVFLCTSPKPATLPSQIPSGVHSFRATRGGIRSAALELADAGRDLGADVFVLFSGHGARIDGSDVLMASDYRSHDGDKCIRLDALHAWLLPAMGPGTHYWFVEACRNELDFLVGELALPRRTSDKGRATSNDLFATAAGTAARAQSKFPQALLDSLYGNGPAKAWLEGCYWVTFPVVAEVVRGAVQPEGMDVDPRPAFVTGRILQLARVPDVTVTIDVRGAQDGERYQLVLSGDRPAVYRWITWPEQQVDVPPGRYFASLLRDGTEETEWISQPRYTPVPIYEATRLEFDRSPPTGQSSEGLTVVGPSSRTARSRVSWGTTARWLGLGAQTRLFGLYPGLLNVELFDRDERVRSVEYRGRGNLHIDQFIDDQFDLGDLSQYASTEAVIDPDPALRLCLLAAAAIGDVAPYAPAVAKLTKFDDLAANEARIYAITPPGKGVMTVQGGLHSARLTLVRGVKPTCCHAAIRAEPGMPHRVHLEIPGADMTIATVALAGRVTVIVVQPEQNTSGETPTWRIHQLALEPGHLTSSDPAALLPAVRFSALVQRRISQGRPAMAAEPDPEHAQLWAQVLEGRWPDPLTMLLTAYELVRRGALAGEGRSALLGLVAALREYGPAFAADLAILDALAVGRNSRPSGEPLAVDGVVAMGGERVLRGPEGMALDYRGAWTRWRAWPARHQANDAEPEISERNRASVAQKIQTLFIDDLDGSAAEGTVRFGLDGTEYEIDLNAEHAKALRDALARYVGAARRVSGGARRPPRSGRRTSATGLKPTEVREWAKAQGIEVKDRGRVPAELVVKFRAATAQ